MCLDPSQNYIQQDDINQETSNEAHVGRTDEGAKRGSFLKRGPCSDKPADERAAEDKEQADPSRHIAEQERPQYPAKIKTDGSTDQHSSAPPEARSHPDQQS